MSKELEQAIDNVNNLLDTEGDFIVDIPQLQSRSLYAIALGIRDVVALLERMEKQQHSGAGK